MARRNKASEPISGGSSSNVTSGSSPPPPFKPVPDSLELFYSSLSTRHIYIAHVDAKPRDLKRKIFLVPVLMNIAVALLFVWRVWYIGPYYVDLLTSSLGYENNTTMRAEDLSYYELAAVIGRRTFTFILDLCLVIFVWPWPVEFCFARGGSPVSWRWAVGFRDKEIYVRRSREWDRHVQSMLDNTNERNLLLSRIRLATSPMLIQDKTGYLTMNGDWDLDWGAMVHATALVDDKKMSLDDFRTLVLVHSDKYGWICQELFAGESPQEDQRRRQIFAFREALASMDKEDVFFRWIELVQFEASRPGGIGPKQEEVADKVKQLFTSNGIEFESFWRDAMAAQGLPTM